MLAAIDLETTGLEPGWHEITEIGIWPSRGPPFYRRVKPRHPERDTAQHITGIDPFEAAPLLGDVLDDLDTYLGGQRLTPIAHNWPFEYSMLTCAGAADFFQYHNAVCTLQQAHVIELIRPGYLPRSKSLSALTGALGIKNNRPHRALPDARAGYELYKHFLNIFTDTKKHDFTNTLQP
jgi:DNA polymerase-3 subunit epsilon